jgi:hypothetical protein
MALPVSQPSPRPVRLTVYRTAALPVDLSRCPTPSGPGLAAIVPGRCDHRTVAKPSGSKATYARRVVFLSSPHQTPHPFFQQPNPMAVLHADIERLIAAAGLESTIIRLGCSRRTRCSSGRAAGGGHAARRVGRNDWKADVHHLYGVRHPRISAAIVSPVGRRSRHRVYGGSSPIELTFATVRHRTKVTKGPGSKAAGIAMAFKLTGAAQERWRAASAPPPRRARPRRGRVECGKLAERDPYSRPPKPPTTPLFSRPPPGSTRQQRRVMIFIHSLDNCSCTWM